MIVVVSLIVHKQSIVMCADIHRTIRLLMDCIYLESFQRQCDVMFLPCTLIITEQSILSTYP